MGSIVPIEVIDKRILLIRREKVILDNDLAELYRVGTKALNQAVKRNKERFPDDFMFQLTEEEKKKVVTNCDHLSRLKYSPNLPFAFTEHGAIMAATILNSPIAVQASIHIVRTFIRLRQILASSTELSRKLDTLEKKYDAQFRVVFDAIHQLMAPPIPKKRIFERKGRRIKLFPAYKKL